LWLAQPGEAAQAHERALQIRRTLEQPHLATETLAGLARVALSQNVPHHRDIVAAQREQHPEPPPEHVGNLRDGGADK